MNLTFTEAQTLTIFFDLVRIALILLAGLIGARLIRGWILKLGTRRRLAMNVAALLANLSQVSLYILAIVLLLPVFGVSWNALLAVLGTAGLAISLAFQDVLRNFIAGIYILLERPFQIGDTIAVGADQAVKGTVQVIALRTTSLRGEDGMQVIVPNGTIFTSVVVNRSAINMERHVLEVTLAHDDHTLTTLTGKIDTALRAIPGIGGSPPPSTQVESLTSDAIRLHASFWTPPAKADAIVAAAAVALRQTIPTADVAVVS